MNTKAIEKAQKELARAKKALRAAKNLLNDDLPEDSVSRAYYAVMHAAKGALALTGIETSSHQGVRNQFGLHLVKPGKIENEYARILDLEYDSREIGDYEIDLEIPREVADERVNSAVEFIKRIEKYISENT